MPGISIEQENVLHRYISSDDNIAIISSAGSGKTTTASLLMKHTDDYDKIQYLVFNKKNALEAQEKFKGDGFGNVSASTIHSLGMGIITHNLGNVKVDNNKQFSLIMDHFSDQIEQNPEKGWSNVFKFDKVVSLLRTAVLNLNMKTASEYLSYHTLDITPKEVRLAITLSKKLRKRSKTIDYSNMIEYPALLDFKIPVVDVLIIDEAQDISVLTLEILKKLEARKYIFMLDLRQSCYMFAGAHPYIYDRIQDSFDPVEMTLSTSFRCDKAICDLANSVYPNSNYPREDAGEGEVYEINDLSLAEEGDFVLCRTTAPLVEAYLYLINQGIACTVIGRGIEKQLKKAIKKASQSSDYDSSIETLLAIMKDNILSAKSKKDKGEAEDMYNALYCLSSDCTYVSELESVIEEMFDVPEGEYIKLMTIHRSKGLEANGVHIITHYKNKELLPSPYAETKEEILNETNLKYISYTRARHKTTFIKI